MINTILAALVGAFSVSTVVLSVALYKFVTKTKQIEQKLKTIDTITRSQKDLESIMTTGIASFLHLSLKQSLVQLETMQTQLQESDKVNEELTQWVGDFGKLTENVYLHLKSIDERGMFEKDDDVGLIFKDMVNIITEYNTRINNIQNDDRNNTTDEKKQG